MFDDSAVPSPKNFCEYAKIEKPAVIGRFLMYGSVNEKLKLRWRLPAATINREHFAAAEQVVGRIVQTKERTADAGDAAVK